MFPDEESQEEDLGDIFDPIAAKQAYFAEQQTATTAVASPPTTIFDAPTTDPNYLTPVADAFVGTNTYEAPSISDSPNTSLYGTPIIDLSVNPSPYDSTSVADIPQYIPPEPTPYYDPYASVPPVETYVPPTTIFDAPVASTAPVPATTTTAGPIAPGGETNTVGGAEIIGADGGNALANIQSKIDLLNQQLEQLDPEDPNARSQAGQINEAIFNLNQRMNQLLGTYTPNVVQPNPNVTPTTPTTPGTSVGPLNPSPGAAKSPIDLAVERNVASARAKVGGRDLTDDEIAMAVNGAMLEVYGPPDPTQTQNNIFTINNNGVPLIIPLPIDPALAALLSLGSIFAGGIPSLFPSGSTPAGVTGGTPGGVAGGTAGGTTGGTGTTPTGGGGAQPAGGNPKPEEEPPEGTEWELINGVWQAVAIRPPNQPPGPDEEWKRVDGIWILVPKPAGPQPECPPGKERDASGECVDQPTECPPGQMKGPDGRCIPIVVTPPPEEEPCPVGQVRGPDGRCIPLVVTPLPCPPGQTRGADGQCAPITNPPPPPPPPEECPVGQVKGSDGVCRPIIVLPPPPPPPPPPQPPPTIFTPVTTTPYTFVTPQPGNLILRDYGKEFGTTSEALQAQAQPILNLYQDILTRYTPATMTQFAGTAQQRLGTDLAALQAVEQGQLSAEDVRRAQQSAREAYGARGMLFSPGAVGAEILNRQAIQDAREAEARANYQQSIQNVANAAQLQTGNIFQPVASLLSQTFSPTSNYANAVYDYNVNAYNAYQAAQENLAAYREAAKSGQQDQFLASFGNFLLKNGITTTRNQLADLFQGILNLGR